MLLCPSSRLDFLFYLSVSSFLSHSIVSSYILNFPSTNGPLPLTAFFLYPPIVEFSLPLAPLLPSFSQFLCPLSRSPVAPSSHHTFPSHSHLSVRSWKSASAIITMQSSSLSERLTARVSRRLNSSQNKSCKHSALNWRMRAKPCWVSSFHVCVCVPPPVTLWPIFL